MVLRENFNILLQSQDFSAWKLEFRFSLIYWLYDLGQTLNLSGCQSPNLKWKKIGLRVYSPISGNELALHVQGPGFDP